MARTVLLVDDDDDIREEISHALRDAGYRVETAPNGASALAKLEHMLPSVVLLDLTMPVMGGWQFLEILRARPAMSEVPVVVISAHQPLPAGHNRVLKKPFDLDAMLDAVHDCSRDAGER